MEDDELEMVDPEVDTVVVTGKTTCAATEKGAAGGTDLSEIPE